MSTLKGLGATRTCPTCRQPIHTYDPDEEPTGRSNATMRLYGEWLARFDRLTDEQRVELIDLLTTYENHTRDEQIILVKAFTGTAVAKFFAMRKSAERLPK